MYTSQRPYDCGAIMPPFPHYKDKIPMTKFRRMCWNISRWVSRRTGDVRLLFARYDRLTIRHLDVKRGRYYDKDYLMIYFLFQLLVDYVEIELAAFDPSPLLWYEKLPLLSDFIEFKHDPRAGVAYLQRQINDPKLPTHQKLVDQEIFDLYMWWTFLRPNRIDYDYMVYMDEALSDKERKKQYAYCDKIDRQRSKEDQAMMIRLIKIRPNLWS